MLVAAMEIVFAVSPILSAVFLVATVIAALLLALIALRLLGGLVLLGLLWLSFLLFLRSGSSLGHLLGCGKECLVHSTCGAVLFIVAAVTSVVSVKTAAAVLSAGFFPALGIFCLAGGRLLILIIFHIDVWVLSAPRECGDLIVTDLC